MYMPILITHNGGNIMMVDELVWKFDKHISRLPWYTRRQNCTNTYHTNYNNHDYFERCHPSTRKSITKVTTKGIRSIVNA